MNYPPPLLRYTAELRPSARGSLRTSNGWLPLCPQILRPAPSARPDSWARNWPRRAARDSDSSHVPRLPASGPADSDSSRPATAAARSRPSAPGLGPSRPGPHDHVPRLPASGPADSDHMITSLGSRPRAQPTRTAIGSRSRRPVWPRDVVDARAPDHSPVDRWGNTHGLGLVPAARGSAAFPPGGRGPVRPPPRG